MLARLGIRQKLSLLSLFPLVAVVLVMVPFTAERIDDARQAGRTASTALAAREIGALIQLLQQERLLALGYLAAPNLERSALVAQTQDTIDAAARLRATPVTADVLAGATVQLAALAQVRERVVARTIDVRAAYAAYRAANLALLNALRLADPAGADAEGLGQLNALEALMRANEEASSAGAGLVAVAGGLPFDPDAIDAAQTNESQYSDRFGALVTRQQAALVRSVENGEAGVRFDAMVSAAVNGSAVTVSDALPAALSYTALRRLAQDRIAREIATAATSRADAARAVAVGVTVAGGVLIALVLGLGVIVSRSIAVPLGRLTKAAGVVAELSRAELVRVADTDSPDPAPPQVAAVDVDSADEIGELATAMNRVQATAALLLERQVSGRRNVGVMFANIARRTQNLVGRQLALIGELERDERDPRLLGLLRRLDHIATRLRRSADSLLVLSGTIDQFTSGSPSKLIDVIQAALDEIEGSREVEFGDVCDVAVSAGLVTDLRLLLAELLENACNFSPPGSVVRVAASLAGPCRITIVDHGLGLSAQRIAEENRRLVERERLDVAPTSVLGLFVVGRLARRHGLSVQLGHSEGRGVTATVTIPARLVNTEPVIGALARRARTRARDPMLAIEAAMVGASGGSFEWFTRPTVTAIGSSPTVSGRASVPQVSPTPPATRVPAAANPLAADPAATGPPEPAVAAAGPSAAGPSAPAGPPEPPRAADAGAASAAPPGHAGLVRRIPGANMVEGVRVRPDEPTVRIMRDPAAERDAVNDFLSGLARGSDGEAEPPAQPAHPSTGEGRG